MPPPARPKSREAFWLRALAFLQKQDALEALTALDEVLRLDERDASAHYQRGLAHGRLKKPDLQKRCHLTPPANAPVATWPFGMMRGTRFAQ